MIFKYDELKEYVSEDFKRFQKMNYNEKQIYPAILEEYKHGEDFSEAENICIHVILAMVYAAQRWDYSIIISKLKLLWKDETENQLEKELGDEYIRFYADFERVMKYE